MATSGTNTFIVTRDDIINAALRGLHVYGPTDTVPPADITYCAQALNIICKSLTTKGALIWTVGETLVPTVANNASYQIGPSATGTGAVVTPYRPMRVLSAYLRDANGNDIDVKVESRFDYNLLGNKTTSGQPNQLFYDPQFPNGIVTLYNVPADALSTLHLIVQRQVQDFNLSTDNPDFPQEFYQPLKWLLMDEVALEYEATPLTLKLVAAKAQQYLNEVVAFEQEDVSITFSPNQR